MTRKQLVRLGLSVLVLINLTSTCVSRKSTSLEGIRQIPADYQRWEPGVALGRPRTHVEEGTSDAAKEYYRDTVSPHLQFLTSETIEGSTIKNLLEYFGYNDVTATDLHRLASIDLMELSEEGNILATRFFAPKITDVNEKPVPLPEGGFGWRKLVRFKAKITSDAQTNGMEYLFFLQNIFEKSIEGDPFDPEKNISKFNQAIVVRKDPPFSDTSQPIYFLTYGRLVKVDDQERPIKDSSGNFQNDGILILNLEATFDENDRDPETNLKASQYYVPDSCMVCHGRLPETGKLNYLDTDHWFDRVTPNYGIDDPAFAQEDFTSLAASSHGILYDGEKNPDTESFKTSFDVIRTINEEIRDQNASLGAVGNFQLEAAKRWLEIHAPNTMGYAHVPPYERGFGLNRWDAKDLSHKKLLYFLNRFCYRCHSSVKYNVFDRDAVYGFRGDIRNRVLNISNRRQWMPQDRIFPGLVIQAGKPAASGDLKEFLDLLEQLKQAQPPIVDIPSNQNNSIHK